MMIKKYPLFLLSLLAPLLIHAQNHFIADLNLRALLHGEENAFWAYSNANGIIDSSTWLLGSITSEYASYIGEYSRLAVGGSAFYALNQDRPDGVALNQYYGVYELHNFGLTLGAKQAAEQFMGLSSVGGDIMRSTNARAIPGIALRTIAPIRISSIVSVDGAFGHYLLNDDRHVDNARLHYKQLTFHIKTSRSSVFSAGLHHYVQWGGVSSTIGPQPDSFKDYLRVIFGKTGTVSANTSDQLNALGNHLGSYQFDYKYTFRNKEQLHVYHQTLFEDNSGRELNNFPDGVWGAFWSAPNNTYIKGLLYEYQHTLSQSGDSPTRGNDNYFNNGTYRSGWTYFGNTIGTPFMTPNRDGTGIMNNTFRAHHIGLAGSIAKLEYRFRGSYVENMGLRGSKWEPAHKNLYTYLQLHYRPSERQVIGLSLGGDLNNPNNDQFTLGLEYGYRFGRLARYLDH